MTSVENTYKNCNTINPNPKYCPTIPLRAYLILLTTFNRKKGDLNNRAQVCADGCQNHISLMWNVYRLHYYPTLERPPNLPLTHQATITHHQLSVLLCECNLCISVIRWHSRNHNQAKTRTTVETTDYPSPKPQPNKPQNHIQPNQAWKHSRTNPKTKAKPILQPQSKLQPNQSHNRSRNYPAPPRVCKWDYNVSP